jgi:acyl-CoA synthetase (AMP-forming)/AMP-acid ligase II
VVCVSPAQGDDRYRLMLGYWNRPDASAEALAGDELHSGDAGFLDDQGYLHLRDRLSLVIIRGGANVYPAEVERVLLEAPGVSAGAVFGVPDERLGERVMAVVETEGGAGLDEEAVRTHCLANLARYKVPERFVVVPQLPRNAMGKIVRTDLPAASGGP